MIQDVTDQDLGLPYQSASFLDNLPNHLKRLCEYKLLSPAAERDLFLRLNACKYHIQELLTASSDGLTAEQVSQLRSLENTYDRVRAVLIRSNTRLVIATVKKYANQSITFDNLLSLGIESLVETLDSFNVLLGYRFSTYLCTILRRKCVRHLDKHYKTQARFQTGATEHFNKLQDSPQTEQPLSQSACESLNQLVHQMDERTSYILTRRFGLDGQEAATLSVIADEIGLSKERVRQIEKKSLHRLKSTITQLDSQSFPGNDLCNLIP
jgi:RNA polymerase sigma factor (sigma-70 family)